MINNYKIEMEGADWKKLLFFGSLSGLRVWGFKWNLRTLQKLEIKRDKLKSQQAPYTVASLSEKK
jgi:hypothetical protein